MCTQTHLSRSQWGGYAATSTVTLNPTPNKITYTIFFIENKFAKKKKAGRSSVQYDPPVCCSPAAPFSTQAESPVTRPLPLRMRMRHAC